MADVGFHDVYGLAVGASVSTMFSVSHLNNLCVTDIYIRYIKNKPTIARIQASDGFLFCVLSSLITRTSSLIVYKPITGS